MATQESSIDTLSNLILSRWNPTGHALAAQFWQRDNAKGFSPVCRYRFNKEAGCLIESGKKGSCKECQIKEYLALDHQMVKKHLTSRSQKTRYGIYPMLEGNFTPWVAVDFDDHTLDGTKDPVADLKSLVTVCQALNIPFFAFTSNSGKGYHLYLFFSEPIHAYKGRALMLGIIKRTGIDLSHKKDREGSIDCIFPKQAALTSGQIGNLIALPWNGRAMKKRKATLYLNPNTLEPFKESRNDNIEYFDEHFESLSEKSVDILLKEMQIKPTSPGTSHRQYDNSDKNYPPADFDRIVEGCSFMQHWKDKAASLGEPAWYAGLTIVARCLDGAELAHMHSRAYPYYTPEETEAKIKHALQDSGPLTCRKIKEDPSMNEGTCDGCLIGEGDLITSPIVLGMEENIISAQIVVDDLLASSDPKQAVINALSSPSILGNLALLADEDRGKYEAMLLRLRDLKEVKDKDIRALEKTVNNQRRRNRPQMKIVTQTPSLRTESYVHFIKLARFHSPIFSEANNIVVWYVAIFLNLYVNVRDGVVFSLH